MAIAAALLGATAKVIGLTVHLVEIISYVLVILIGLWLLYVKGRGFLIACRELTWRQAPNFAFASALAGKSLLKSHNLVVQTTARRNGNARRAMSDRGMHRSRARLPVP